MSNFDWHTEEDARWDEESPPQPKPPRRYPIWTRVALLLVIVLVGAGTVAGLVYQRLSQRVEEVSFAVESDVRASHSMMYQAALGADRDLFIPFLSGRDPDWSSAQERVIGAGLFYERPGFGLIWLPQEVETAVSGVTTDPTLTAAVLTATHAYAVAVGNGLTQTITLQRTAVFRLGPDRWLYAPPEEEFWGEMQSSEGTLLSLTYPERDAEVSQRLAADLEAKIQELCTRFVDLACGSDLHITVEFSADPAAVYESNQLPMNVTITVPRMRSLGWYSFPARLGEETLTLPTPSLVGNPLDEAGYQALYRGYAARVISAIVAEQVGWKCCDRSTLFQVLLDVQLDQLGLKRWPVQERDYELLLGTPMTAIYEAWSGAEFSKLEEAIPLYVLVDFLLRDVQTSPVALQRALTGLPAEGWLENVLQSAYPTLADGERGWLRFLYERSSAYLAVPDVPLPSQPLYMVCRPHNSITSYLYRHDLGTGEFAVARALVQETAVLLSLPDQEQLLVGEISNSAARSGMTFIWADERTTFIPQQATATGQNALPIAASPDGALAILSAAGESIVPYSLLDVSACQNDGECDMRPLLGVPVWSPNAQRTILERSVPGNGVDSLIFVGDEFGESVTLVGEGRFPFWLDDQSHGYVNREGVVMSTTLGALDSRPIVSLSDLLPILPPRIPTASLAQYEITYAGFSKESDSLLLVVNEGPLSSIGAYHIVEHPLATGEPALQYTMERGASLLPYEATLSPNGRWLTLLAPDNPVMQTGSIYVFDVETWTMQIYPLDLNAPGPELPSYWLNRLVDWSADGNWMVIANDGYMRFIAPGIEYERWLLPDQMTCDQAVWGQ